MNTLMAGLTTLQCQLISKRVIVSGGLVLFASTLVSATAASQRRAVTPLDFLTTREASSPQISPDGQTVVFVLEEPGPRKDRQPWRGDQDLWRVPADGSAPPHVGLQVQSVTGHLDGPRMEGRWPFSPNAVKGSQADPQRRSF